MTLKLLLLCSLFFIQLSLKGQTLSGEAQRREAEAQQQPKAWYFAYENLEKAVAGNPAASARFIPLTGSWKFSGDAKRHAGSFYTFGFDDGAWETVMLPPEVPAGSGDVKSAGVASGSGEGETILYRKTFDLEEAVVLGKEIFISLAFPAPAALWVNGQPAGNTTAGWQQAGFNISAFVQPGENLLAIRAGDGVTDTAADTAAGVLPGMGEVLLYTRPETHFGEISFAGTLDNSGKKGLLELHLSVENRMDSVRERFWGVLREPLFSTASVKAQLVDDEGNKIIDFKKENTRKIRGGDSVVFNFKGTVNNVMPWTHEKPKLYRLNILLLDGGGNVLETVSGEVGFRNVGWQGGELVVNRVEVPLRIFEPGFRPAYGLDSGQLMQDIREIKQGNFNAVYADPYLAYRSWYELCNRFGVYVLDRGLHGNRNNPSVIPVPAEKKLPEGAPEPVVLHLGDFFKGTIRMKNTFAFRDLSGYYLEWVVLRNGKKAEEGRVQDLQVPPGAEAGLSLDYKVRFYRGNDYFLNLKVKTKTGNDLVPAGFTIASRQFRLSPYQYEEAYQVDKGLIDVTDGPGSIALNGYDFRIVFDKSRGQIIRYSYKGKELMNGGPELNFPEVRPAENALTAGVPGDDSLKESRALWSDAVRESNLLEYKVTEDVNGNYYISFTKVLLGGDARLFQKFRVDGRGAILVENVFVRMEGTYPLMPGFGTRFELPGDFRKMEWYGREPAAKNEVGIYSGEITGQTDSGKSDVRWVRLTRADGYGLLIRKEDELLHLRAVREGSGDGPVMLNVDLSQKPVPFKSRNFTYRIIPYVPTAAVQ